MRRWGSREKARIHQPLQMRFELGLVATRFHRSQPFQDQLVSIEHFARDARRLVRSGGDLPSPFASTALEASSLRASSWPTHVASIARATSDSPRSVALPNKAYCKHSFEKPGSERITWLTTSLRRSR